MLHSAGDSSALLKAQQATMHCPALASSKLLTGTEQEQAAALSTLEVSASPPTNSELRYLSSARDSSAGSCRSIRDSVEAAVARRLSARLPCQMATRHAAASALARRAAQSPPWLAMFSSVFTA